MNQCRMTTTYSEEAMWELELIRTTTSSLSLSSLAMKTMQDL